MGETFSITRVSYLLSDFALQREDGSWLSVSNSVAWLDHGQNRHTFQLGDVTPGQYRAIRFAVGLDPERNHIDVSKLPAQHPLNPTLNGLHWSWQGGYIFMALEGLWRNASGALDGWSYHLARDGNVTPLTLALALSVEEETRIELDLDLASVLSVPRPLSFEKDGSSTHSREGDPVAAALIKNLAGAFRVQRVRPLKGSEITPPPLRPLYLPASFKPFEFRMSRMAPIPDLPRDNPLLVERVELGRRLFFDRRLSINGSQSCSDCHVVGKAFTDGRRTSPGAEGISGTRNSMPLFNLAWKREFFWDGRAASLREQVLQPIQDPIEMHESLTNLVNKLSQVAGTEGYPAQFAAAFGGPEITAQKIALALENYLLTLTSFDSKFDRVLAGAETLTPEEQRGFELFSTEYDPRRGQFGADCFHCHGGPLFQSQAFANNGLDAVPRDVGREKVTGKASDRGKFAAPSLRNIELTAPYMHDGRFQTLDEVVEHYSKGVVRSSTLDPNLAKHPDGGVPLSSEDKKALVAFLKTLTDRSFVGATGR